MLVGSAVSYSTRQLTGQDVILEGGVPGTASKNLEGGRERREGERERREGEREGERGGGGRGKAGMSYLSP